MISAKTRFKTFLRDKFTCQYCGRSSPEVILEIDHVLPVSKGGTDKDDNLVTACRECNKGKADLKITGNSEDFYEQVKRYDAQCGKILELIDYCGNHDPTPLYLIKKLRNKKIKQMKYIIEYLENMNRDLTEAELKLKEKYITGVSDINELQSLEDILNYRI